MNVMVVGGGGREHAIIKALKKNPAITTLYALPGNGGIAGRCHLCGHRRQGPDGDCGVCHLSRHRFAVVAPDDPLVLVLSTG